MHAHLFCQSKNCRKTGYRLPIRKIPGRDPLLPSSFSMRNSGPVMVLASGTLTNNNMKEQAPKQFAGVWLDNQHAMIISKNADDFEVTEKIKSVVSQSGGNEHTINNGKNTEHLKFLKSVSAALTSFDEILIFGPGQAQEQLQHHLADDQQFKGKKISIDTAEKMTDPQAVAAVRTFFKGRAN